MTDPFAALRLDGKVVVVTGATQGLGAAIARRAAALGAAGIVVTGRDRERGEAVRDSLACEAVFVPADARGRASVPRDRRAPPTSASGGSTGSSTPPG